MKKSISIVTLILFMLFTAVLGGFFSLTLASGRFLQEKESPGLEPSVQKAEAISSEQTVSQISKTLSQSVVGISSILPMTSGSSEVQTEIGSGVIIDSRGYIVTNYHVIAGGERIAVALSDGSAAEATVVGTDARTDLALLKIDGDSYEPAVLGDSDQLVVGETAIAIGNPGGLDFAGSVTMGIISGLNRPLVTDEGLRFKLIQTDAAINPGNSGGALANGQGEVIGINTIKISETGFEGMGFAIPSSLVKEIITELMDTGKVTRAAMGIRLIASIDAEFNALNKVGVDHGVLISPQQGGAGASAGLKENDIIIAVDDNQVNDIYELQEVIFKHEVGDSVVVTVVRGGETLSVAVTLGELKEE